jgi:hypothetical protein
MPENLSRFSQFRSDIRRLVAEIEKYVRVQPRDPDREYRLQCEAFQERRDHASRLADEISADEQTQWRLHDGDAQRIHDSLRLSLDYFRPDA